MIIMAWNDGSDKIVIIIFWSTENLISISAYHDIFEWERSTVGGPHMKWGQIWK